ncbi:hypothetical protein D3C73_720400 [compost metagenome]
MVWLIAAQHRGSRVKGCQLPFTLGGGQHPVPAPFIVVLKPQIEVGISTINQLVYRKTFLGGQPGADHHASVIVGVAGVDHRCAAPIVNLFFKPAADHATAVIGHRTQVGQQIIAAILASQRRQTGESDIIGFYLRLGGLRQTDAPVGGLFCILFRCYGQLQPAGNRLVLVINATESSANL